MMTTNQMLHYLQLLNDELKEINANAEIILAVGASMCLVHEARDMTKDIDALYEPRKLINELVKKISIAYNLAENWLNDSLKGFAGPNAPIEHYISFGNLIINTVSPNYLLSMKLMASRYEIDHDDIKFLLKKLNIKTREEAIDNLLNYFLPNQILPKTMYAIDMIIEQINNEEIITETSPTRPKM